MADWLKIKTEYISTDISTRALAEKCEISYSTLDKRSRKEHWATERREQRGKVAAKVRQKVAAVAAAKEVDRLTRILNLSDAAVAMAEQASKEITKYAVSQKIITDGVGVDATGRTAKGRKIKTTIEVIDIGMVDMLALKRLASTIKDLRDVAATPRADEQSLSKVAEMMARLDKEAASDALPE